MLTYHALCDNRKLVKPTKEFFIIRYYKNSGIFFLSSNRRLTRYQYLAKRFPSIDSAKAFAFFDVNSGHADVVKPYEMGV